MYSKTVRPALAPRQPTCHAVRCFSQTAAAQAKKNKADKQEKSSKKGAAAPAAPSSNGNGSTSKSNNPKPNPEDPFDLSDLEAAFAKAAEHHIDNLKKLRTGGRFNPDVIGALRVRPDKKDPATFPLHELAAIVPKGGRTISILVHELDHVKPVLSAIQTSPDFNQQPQRVEDNEQELVLKVEAEKADDVAKRVKEICHAWRGQIREHRHKRDVVLKKWRADNTILPDDLKRIEKDMQKLQDKKMAEIDAEEKKALQQLARDR